MQHAARLPLGQGDNDFSAARHCRAAGPPAGPGREQPALRPGRGAVGRPRSREMTTPNKTPPGADPKQLERTGTVREIGSQAVWSLSSCKPGFGVDQLRDDNLETYWQSDGSQPHLVNIQFRRKTTVKTLCIYADYKSDESYTPSKISVRVGNNFHNLQEIRQLELVEPSGWIHVPLTDTHKKPIRTFMIQIAVLANHQNGRDTHMRQIKVYTPVEESSIGKFPRCTTIDFMMYRSIR
ncbi:anaphase-promoting complex subunit 10 isoform X1 [Ciconia boyciana]|uniref:anaphase-promoting complex subunit 10 isoform X1 n=1 Tax=Ciconia boyciana TaxID=52775 RepID=UPI003BA07D54